MPLSLPIAFARFSVYHMNMIIHGKRPFLIVFCVLVLSLAGLAGSSLSAAEVAVIKVNYRSAADILPLVGALLSPGGKASVDTRTNSLIVVDTGESLAKIQTFVASMDKPAEQVKVRFRFQETGLSTDRDLSASGRVSGDRWSVTTGGGTGEGVHVRARDNVVNRRGNTESFISVMSGSSAYLWVGRDIPFTERWVYLTHHYAHVVETVNFQRVETGFEMRPIVAGNNVQIQIVPRISSFDRGEQVVRLTEAATTLSVPKGQWVIIGGTSEQSNEVFRDILSYGSSSTNSSLSLSLMVE
jgi:type II secretory pathway component GspD/PulD (secretin)